MLSRLQSKLVVLSDICVCAIEEFPSGGQAVLLEREPYFSADGSVSVLGLAPAGEANLPDDRVDVVDHVLDDYWDVRGAYSRKICVSAPTFGSGRMLTSSR